MQRESPAYPLLPAMAMKSRLTLLDCNATDRFRQRATGLPEYTFHRGGSCRIADSLKEWNAKGSDGVAAIVRNRKRNIDYTLYIITFSLVKSPLFNLGQVLAQIARRTHSIVLTPELYNPREDFGGLMRQDYLSRCRTHQVSDATSLHVKAAAERRIDLGDDYNTVSVEHSQMARLVDLARDVPHDRQGFSSQALNWRMLVCQLKQMQGQRIALVGTGSSNITAGLKAHQHPEDLRDSATEPASNVSFCEPIRLTHKKLEHIKTFFQGWRWIAASDFSSCHHVRSRIFGRVSQRKQQAGQPANISVLPRKNKNHIAGAISVGFLRPFPNFPCIRESFPDSVLSQSRQCVSGLRLIAIWASSMKSSEEEELGIYAMELCAGSSDKSEGSLRERRMRGVSRYNLITETGVHRYTEDYPRGNQAPWKRSVDRVAARSPANFLDAPDNGYP
jgi:hypothetical protein